MMSRRVLSMMFFILLSILISGFRNPSDLFNITKESALACSVEAKFYTATSTVKESVPITFTNTTFGATSYQWLVNGSLITNTTDFIYTFPMQGSYTIQMVASNSSCSDTSDSFFVQAGACGRTKAADKWNFGQNAAVSFSNGAPVSINGSAMNQREGVASIADAQGNLLFYSDGNNVWGSNNLLMPNGTGLKGSSLSAQSSIIVPAPGSTNLYYIFTVHNWTDATSEFCYSIIDMNLRGGLGDVISGSKNIIIQNNIYEQVTASFHKNCKDVWIISHEKNNNSFVSYLLTSTGLIMTPVISSVGSVSNGGNRYGSLRASHKGNKICSSLGGASTSVELYDFNKTTGSISNAVTLNNGNLYDAYSSEFSSNDRLLYVVSYNGYFVTQFDLYAGSAAAIRNSATIVSTQLTVKAALQMGPDGRIYVSRDYGNYLGVIDNPNAKGFTCNYIEDGVFLGTGLGRLGLPNFLPGFFGDVLSINGPDQLCNNTVRTYTLSSSDCVSNIQWTFNGDGKILNANQDSVTIQFFSHAGVYTLMAVGQTPCGNVSTKLLIDILSVPDFNLGSDSTFCTNISYTFHGPSGASSYAWNTGSSNNYLAITNPGKYWLTITNSNGCKASDTVNIFRQTSSPVINLGPDTIVCKGQRVVLKAGNGYLNYTWKNGSTYSSDTIYTSGKYWVKVSDACGSNSDTINISEYNPVSVHLGKDTNMCNSGTVLLNAGTGFSSYLWNDGSDQIYYTATKSGSYFVEVTDIHGCKGSDTISVSIFPTPLTPIFPKKSIANCFDEGPVTIETAWGKRFHWMDNNDTSSAITVNKPGTFVVGVVDQYGCSYTDQITVYNQCVPKIFVPEAFSPNQDGSNDDLEIFGKYFSDFEIIIFNRWGEIIFISKDRKIRWDGTYRGEDMQIGTYPWILHYKEDEYGELSDIKTMRGSVTLIR